jgi:hypothetical protein
MSDGPTSSDDEAPPSLDRRAVAFAAWDAIWLGFAMAAFWAPFELWVLHVKRTSMGFVQYRFPIEVAGGGFAGWFVIILGLATLTRRPSLAKGLALRVLSPICALVAGLAWILFAPA